MITSKKKDDFKIEDDLENEDDLKNEDILQSFYSWKSVSCRGIFMLTCLPN